MNQKEQSPEGSSPRCSLIICAYNQCQQLGLVLDSALKQTERGFEIIIADDGSEDGTKELVCRFAEEHPKLPIRHVWHEDKGHRKTVILNAAAKEARAPYLVFIDGDIILHHRFIEMHLKYAHPKKVACGWRGCKIRQDFAEKMMRGEVNFSTYTLSVFFRGLRGEVIHPFRTTIIENKLLRKLFCKERGYVGGCNFGLHKSNYELCNGMDETIQQFGYEDVEIGQRLINNGILPAGIRNCANTYHLEHKKTENPNHSKYAKLASRNRAKQCKFGLTTLESGSSEADLVALDKG